MKTHYDYIIIGAGPAGLQLGYYFQQNNIDYLILEGGSSPGSSFKKFPRHGTLISINKIYTGYQDKEINLRWDWNSLLCDSEDFDFKEYSKSYFPEAKDLVRYLHDYATRFNINIKFNQKVEVINKPGQDLTEGGFMLKMVRGDKYYCNKLIVATGFSEPYLPDIPGIGFTENYVDTSINKEDFINKKVLIIGKGNSGFETADNLTETASLIHICSPESVKFAWQTHYVGNLRAINNNFLDTYQLKSQNAILDAEIRKISKDGNKYLVHVQYAHAGGEQEVLDYDRVIVCTGFKLDRSIFGTDCMPETIINNRLPALNPDWESVNIKGLYFAGILMQGNFYQKTTSGFIHGFRYNVKTLFHMLQAKYNGQSLPSKNLSLESKAITGEILKRVNRSSALWQQFGYLIDIIEIGDHSVQYYYELPKDYKNMISENNIFTLSLEFGAEQQNVFQVNRNTSAEKAEDSFFLHPVVRHYRNGNIVSTLHLIEDLFGEWKHEEKHIKVLIEYIERELATIGTETIVG